MKGLATFSSRGHLGKWFEGSACAGWNYVSAKDNRTLLFLENGDMISMNKKRKRPIVWFDNFVYHMHNSNKMAAFTFCKIKGFEHLNSGCILRKWKKGREPSVIGS
jgi:hypothetical protein